MQRSARRYLRIVAWVITANTVGFIVLEIFDPVPRAAGIGLTIEFVGLTLWLHGLVWAFPLLCELASNRDRPSSGPP